jgi:hypothetical protein
MNSKTITQQLESLNINIDEISNNQVSQAIHVLLQIIEGLHLENVLLYLSVEDLLLN